MTFIPMADLNGNWPTTQAEYDSHAERNRTAYESALASGSLHDRGLGGRTVCVLFGRLEEIARNEDGRFNPDRDVWAGYVVQVPVRRPSTTKSA